MCLAAGGGLRPAGYVLSMVMVAVALSAACLATLTHQLPAPQRSLAVIATSLVVAAAALAVELLMFVTL